MIFKYIVVNTATGDTISAARTLAEAQRDVAAIGGGCEIVPLEHIQTNRWCEYSTTKVSHNLAP